MKKSSILSFQFADNYGAVLQIFALSQLLQEKGMDVEVIDFNPAGLTLPYKVGINWNRIFNQTSVIKGVRELGLNLFVIKRDNIKKRNFNDFRKNYLNMTKETYLNSEQMSISSELKKYDYYFVGSDQVWNPAFIKEAGNSYFLNFSSKNSKKIAYAASVAEEISVDMKDIYIENLGRFDYVSVREKTAQLEIQSLFEGPVEVTLDPTMLHTKDFWEEIIDSEPIKFEYLLVYDLVKDSRIIELANEVSKKYGLKIISYSYSRGYENWHSTFGGKHPKEFIKLYRDAKFVITSSFHGTAFSIIFNKPFYTVPHPTRGSRMIDLLNELGLSDRIAYNGVNEIELTNQIDFKKVELILKQRIKSSYEFIDNAISKSNKGN